MTGAADTVTWKCRSCGETVPFDQLEDEGAAGRGHVIPGSIPDLCGPVEQVVVHVCADCDVVSEHCRQQGMVWLCDPCWRTWLRMEQFHAHLY